MTSQKEQELIWTLEDAGHYDEAKIVRSLAQQRAELLEALKEVLPIATKSNSLSVKVYNKAARAITKAEAAE